MLKHNKKISTTKKVLMTIAIVLFLIFFPSAETPNVALGTGWECNISNIGYAMGPAIQIGFAWPKQYIGGSYQWCLLSNHNELSKDGKYHVDKMHHHGGGVTYYYTLLEKSFFSCEAGIAAGFWEQIWDRSRKISNDKGDYEYSFYNMYRFFGGPKVKIQFGVNPVYVVFQYTLFLGKVTRCEIMYDIYNNSDVYDRNKTGFFLRNSVNCMIWLEL